MIALFLPFVVTACVQVQENVKLQPAAETVALAMDPPSPITYRLLGTVRGEAAGRSRDEASASARNDLVNKAAAMGASFVTIDDDEVELLPMQDKSKSIVTGRAYSSID